MSWYGFRPYVSVARRRANAVREVTKLANKGRKISPVKPLGRAIAKTFWGKAWCDNLESYSDYSNRLPRGRTYIRNGSVVDLQIEPGKIAALVSGSELYNVKIKIRPVDSDPWNTLKCRCSGGIGSLMELLQGKLSSGVMQVVTSRDGGLFPRPKEIEMSCSCPDVAGMCKHIAAVLYGVGARLDEQPDLLFKLRQVDHLELIAEAGNGLTNGAPGARGAGSTAVATIAAGDLAEVFGIELEVPDTPTVPPVLEKPAAKPGLRMQTGGTKRKKAGKPGKLAVPLSEKSVPEAPAKPRRGRLVGAGHGPTVGKSK